MFYNSIQVFWLFLLLHKMPEVDHQLYKKAFRKTENPTIIMDRDYIIRDVNQACIEFTGYPRDELIGNTPQMLFPDPDVYQVVVEQLENDQPWQEYFETKTKDGYLVYGQGSVMPLIVNGDKQGYSGIFTDLTERRQHEKALQVIHRVLRHDLKNEMNLLLGYLDTIKADLPEKSHHQVQKVSEMGQRLLRRADKARSLEQLLYEEFEQPNNTVKLGSVVESTADECRQRFSNAEISVASLPVCEVVADGLLEKALESVVENAVIHNDSEPRVEIAVEEHETTADIRIADNGPGIPDEYKDQIFGREEQGDLRHGDGFSLYFVDCVIDLYRGSIEVTDNDWGGVTFEICLHKP